LTLFPPESLKVDSAWNC